MSTERWKHCIANITNDCQCRCPGCYKVLGRSLVSADHMNLEDFDKMLSIFVGQGGETIDLVGGEPTDHPDFLKIVTRCVQAKLEIWIYTNLINFSLNPGLASDLRSLDGNVTLVGKLNVPNPQDSQQRTLQARLIGCPERMVDSLWQGLANVLAAGFPAGKVGVENLIRKNNIVLAPAVYELGIIKNFFVDLEIPTCPSTAGLRSFQQWLDLFPTKEQIISCLAEIRRIDQTYGRPPCEYPMMPHLTGRNQAGIGQGCLSFKRSALLIETDGRVGLCTSGLPIMAGERQLNILFDSLETILAHPAVKRRRQSCQQENIQAGPCQTCNHWNNCLAGCAALRETLNVPLGSYPRCYLGEWKSEAELQELFLSTKKEIYYGTSK